MSNVTLKMAKNQPNVRQHSEAKLLLFENYSLLHPRYHPKIGDILKNIQKTNAFVLMRLFMTRKTRLKNRSHIYIINGPRHGHRYTKCKI